MIPATASATPGSTSLHTPLKSAHLERHPHCATHLTVSSSPNLASKSSQYSSSTSSSSTIVSSPITPSTLMRAVSIFRFSSKPAISRRVTLASCAFFAPSSLRR